MTMNARQRRAAAGVLLRAAKRLAKKGWSFTSDGGCRCARCAIFGDSRAGVGSQRLAIDAVREAIGNINICEWNDSLPAATGQRTVVRTFRRVAAKLLKPAKKARGKS